MRIRIDRIYGIFYHPGFDKHEVVALCYINGRSQYKRLFYNSREEAESVSESTWIDY